nr:MAG TPA: hypothetical protein [Bacteriophage sp.]
MVLDFFTHLAYYKDNPRCPEATPRRGGHASASARTGDYFLYLYGRCTEWMLIV